MSDQLKRGVSRRGFLRGAGVTAAGVALVESGLSSFAPAQETNAVISPKGATISLNINGKDVSLAVEPRATLAEVLRYQLDMTGTKVVCDRGACGGCTVWLDGKPTNSCMTFALDCVGRPIRTIEGLAIGETLHPVQEQFIQHDAMQCGFCTSGMIMSCAALLERNKSPNREQIQSAVSGNLCRCGTYPKVFQAVEAAAKS